MKLEKGMILKKNNETNQVGVNNLPAGTKVELVSGFIENNAKHWRILRVGTNNEFVITEQKLLSADWSPVDVAKVKPKPEPCLNVSINRDVFINTVQGVIVLDSLTDKLKSKYEGEFTSYPSGTSLLKELWDSCEIHGNKVSY